MNHRHRVPRWTPAAARTSRATSLAVGLIAAACGGGNDTATLGGAERLAAGGDATWADVSDMIWNDHDGIVLDDLPLDEAAILRRGSGDDSLVVLFDRDADDTSDGRDMLVTASTADGEIRRAIPAGVSLPGLQTAGDITASGIIARAIAGDPLGASGRDLAGATDDMRITIYDPGFMPRAEHASPFPVRALELADDGSVLAGGLDGQIARIDPDGKTTHLLGPAGSDAHVTTDDALDPGPVVSLLRLPDDRVAFVAGDDGDTRLYLLDGTTARQVAAGDEGAGPVAGADERREPGAGDPFPRPAITPLAPSPDGRVLTTGLGPGGDPQVALVDLDTGDVEVLAVLDGVEPTVDAPVSAAVVGNDLVVLADHQLWHLPDVIVPVDAWPPVSTTAA